MRVLIIGASGNVGTGITEILRDRHQVVLYDLNQTTTDLPFFQGDVQIGWNLLPAAEGCDVIVHTAAWHGIHSRFKTESDYWRLNIDGTFHMFQAAIQQDVQKIIFLSSMSMYNRYSKYGLTKVIGEELCEYYWRNHGLRYIALRPGNFTPWKSFIDYGARFLYGGVDRRDVLQCVMTAVEDESVTNDWFHVQSESGLTEQDIEDWDKNPLGVLERRFPGSVALISKYEIGLERKPVITDIRKTEEILGWKPRHDFATFLEELEELDRKDAVHQQACDY